jgi:hypothetical protein
MATKMFSAGDRRLNANNLAETNPVNTPAVRHEILTTSDYKIDQLTRLLRQRAGAVRGGANYQAGKAKREKRSVGRGRRVRHPVHI